MSHSNYKQISVALLLAAGMVTGANITGMKNEVGETKKLEKMQLSKISLPTIMQDGESRYELQMNTQSFSLTVDLKKPVPIISAVEQVKQQRSNEDRTVINQTDKNIQVFGVFDGHGGSGVCNMLKKGFASHLVKQLTQLAGSTQTIEKICKNIRTSCLEYEEKMAQDSVVKDYNGIKGDNFSFYDRVGGSTANVVVVAGEYVFVVNLGDSRAVIEKQDGSFWHSKDHNPKLEEERIKKAGGWIGFDESDRIWRVMDDPEYFQCRNMLAMSRAFGDVGYGKKVVISEPDVTVFPIADVKTIVQSSDGLWENIPTNGVENGEHQVFETQWKSVCAKHKKDSPDIAKSLVEWAIGTNCSKDDISCIVLDFVSPKK